MTPWGTAWMLLAFMLVNFADKTVLGLSASPVMDELGLTREEFGTASSAFFALFSLAALGGSALTRRVRTPVLLLGMALLWSAAQLPMVFAAAGFGTLLVTRVLLGAAEGPAAPVATHHLHGWFAQRDRTLPTSVLLFGASAGVAVAAPTLGLVIDRWGWRAAFGTVGAAGLAWALLWLRYGQEGPYAPRTAHHRNGESGRPQKHAPGQGHASAPGHREHPEGPEAERPRPLPYRRILLSGTWLAAACGAFAAYWTLSAGLTWSADYFQETSGLSLRHASLLIMLAALSKGLAMVTHGLIVQRAVRRAARGGPVSRAPFSHGVNNGSLMLVSAVATAVFATTDVLWLKVVLLLGPMALADIILSVATTAVSRIAPAPQRGVALGALTGIFALGGFLAPLVMGRVVDAGASVSGGYRDAYLLMAGLLCAAGLIVTCFLRPARDAARLGVPEEPPHDGPGTPGTARDAGPGADAGTGTDAHPRPRSGDAPPAPRPSERPL
ncbi:MFS transporter [Streptomyces daliensis]